MADVNRGVSTTVGYVLNLAVATLLVTALFTAAGGYVGDQQERVIRSELEVIGERVSADIATADRLARTSDGGTVRVEVDLPQRVAGTPYRTRIEPATGEVVLSTTNPNVIVRVPYDAETGVEPSTNDGGRIVVAFNDSGKLRVIGDA